MSTEEPPRWEQYFGFPSPYDNQAEAIKTAIQTAQQRGYLAMEGPCGTGKTMAALTAAAFLIRETDQFENVIVATPVKQQRQQFIEDLRTINRNLEEPLSGVALVGKRDLCPYGREDVFPAEASVQGRCEELRETTAELIRGSDTESAGRQASGQPAESTTAPSPDDSTAVNAGDDTAPGPEPAALIEGVSDDTEQWWDTALARELSETARRDLTAAQAAADGGTNQSKATPLSTAGVSAPYRRTQPAAPDEFTAGDSTPLYCPFEADWYARDKGSPVSFDQGVDHVLSTAEFLPAAVEAGTCPHRVMGVLLEHAEFVIANYNHLFDSNTRHLTESILDEQTLVIIDEAHRIEERVRDLLSETVGRVTLKQAQRDLGTLLERARQHPDNRDLIEKHLASHDVPFEAVEQAHQFYGETIDWLDRQVDAELSDRFDGYGTGFIDDVLPAEALELELRDPRTDERDAFTAWAEDDAGYEGGFFRTLGAVGSAVEDTLKQHGVSRDCVCTATGIRFGQWWSRDNTAFFRELTLEPTDLEYRNPDYPWQNAYNASFVMYNCLPGEAVREILGEFGGGILMSATLEPIDIFETVSGLRSLSTSTPATESAIAADKRPVERRSYTLQFPEANRESWLVDVMAFTARNRGEPVVENRNKTRERYSYVAREIARSYGNILLCYPNYAEARWAAQRLRTEIDKPVFLDESSSHEETQALKQSFVDGEHSVLVTSTRGTLTEGVDYDGEKLHTCAVFGIPLVNIGSPRVQAVRHAYGDRFGEPNEFTYALTIPAVRQVRQAIGRVLRGPDERGVRILVGERYLPGKPRSVARFFSEQERDEFRRMTPEFLSSQFEQFWQANREP